MELTDVRLADPPASFVSDFPEGASLTLRGRTRVGVLLSNPATRVTLLQLLLGHCRAASGEVMVFGHSLHEMEAAAAIEAAARVCGVVSPRLPLLDCLTLSQNIAIPLALGDTPRGEVRERADAILERVGLIDARDQLPAESTLDARVRCAIARALVHRPPLLLLDSPAEGLDTSAAAEIQDLLDNVVTDMRVSVLLACAPGTEPAWLTETLELAKPDTDQGAEPDTEQKAEPDAEQKAALKAA